MEKRTMIPMKIPRVLCVKSYFRERCEENYTLKKTDQERAKKVMNVMNKRKSKGKKLRRNYNKSKTTFLQYISWTIPHCKFTSRLSPPHTHIPKMK